MVQEVYFDNLKIRHIKSPAIQYSEYYPFGLQTACSWTRDNNANNFLYNGGTELNQSSGVYDLFFRNYDPVLGRMNGVDPLAHKYAGLTPYNYAFDSPVNFNDPLGDEPGRRVSVFDEVKARNSGMMIFHDASTGGSGMMFGGPMAGFAKASGAFGPDYYGDAAKVNSGEMSVEDYAKKHADPITGIVTIIGEAGGSLYGFQIEFLNGVAQNIVVSNGYTSASGAFVAYSGSVTFELNKNGSARKDQTNGGDPSVLSQIQLYSDTPLGLIGIYASMAETTALTRAAQLTGLKSALNVQRLATAAKFAKGSGIAGLVVGSAGAGINIASGNGTGADVIDIGATIVAGVAAVVLAPVALPWIAGAAMVYGVTSFVFHDQINESSFGQGASNMGNSILGLTGTTIKIK